MKIAKIFYFLIHAAFLSLCSVSNANDLPDLVVESVDAPLSATPGSIISVTVRFKNQGGDLTKGNYVRCRMIVSQDSDINLDDIYYIQADIYNNNLKSGSSYSQTFSYTLPSTIQGTYYVGAYVDSPVYHSESNENNNANFDSTPLIIKYTELPDLVVESVDAPSSATPGSIISVTVRFKNQGGDLTKGNYVRCRMIVSQDSNINLDDIYYIQADIYNNNLKSGSSYSQTFSYTLPSTIQGTYYVGAYVDSPVYHSESNENNNANFDSTPLIIGNQKTNQSIGSISFNPTTLTVGANTTASAIATSGLPVTFSSNTPSICKISGNTVTGISTGTCTINATQNGDANYNSALTVTSDLTVTDSEISNFFTWPVDPMNRTNGHNKGGLTQCKNKLFCFWISDDIETPEVWYDAQGFQKYNWVGHGWHLGADYNKTNDVDAPIYPISSGIITKVSEEGCAWGRILFIKHETSFFPYTYTSMYAHVNWGFGKPVLGTKVSPDTPIATIGNGTSKKCPVGKYPYHLHFEIRRGDSVVLYPLYPQGKGYWPASKKSACNGKDDSTNNCPQRQIDPNSFIAAHN